MTKKHVFLLGLLVLLIGQILLAQGQDFVNAQQPIDFAHWCLFIGAVLLLPQSFEFPKSIATYIGMPLTVIGIACILGMCVIDFIWWSYPNEEMRQQFTAHLVNVPSIWHPFMTTGSSSKVFNVGLTFLAFNYYKNNKIGFALVVLGTLVLRHIIPLPYRLVSGYSLTLIGFALLFLQPKGKVLSA